MNDGVFLSSSSKLDELLLKNRRKSNDNYDDTIKLYSFNTFESLKDYVKLNELEKYKVNENEQDMSDAYVCKLRTKLSNEKMFSNRKKRRKGKPQKLVNDEDLNKLNVIWQPKVEESSIDFIITEDDSQETQPKTPLLSQCGNEYCNYGCICDTLLNTNTVRRDHCGKIECMFECKCSTQHKKHQKLKTGDYSSSDTQTTSGEFELRRSKRTRIIKNLDDWDKKLNESPIKSSSVKLQKLKKLQIKEEPEDTKQIVEKLDFLGASRNNPKHDSIILKLKNLKSIPLYIESYTDWSLRSSKVLKLIASIVKQLSDNDNYENWEQTELELEPNLIVRLYNTYKTDKFDTLFTFNDKNLKPIFVKIFKERINAAQTSLSRLNTKFNSKILIESKLNLQSKKIQFDTYIQKSQFQEPSVDTKVIQNDNQYKIISSPSAHPVSLPISQLTPCVSIKLTPPLTPVQPTILTPRNDLPYERVFKSLPRLISRKSNILKQKQEFTEISESTKKLKTPQDSHYDPLNDKQLILPLYREHGQKLVDKVCETMNFMLKGVTLYEEHLKLKAEKERQILTSTKPPITIIQNTKKITPILPKLPQRIKIQSSSQITKNNSDPNNQVKTIVKLVSINNTVSNKSQSFIQSNPKPTVQTKQNNKDYFEVFQTFAQHNIKTNSLSLKSPLQTPLTTPSVVKIVNTNSNTHASKIIVKIAPKPNEEVLKTKELEKTDKKNIDVDNVIASRKLKRKQDFTDLLKKFALSQVPVETTTSS